MYGCSGSVPPDLVEVVDDIRSDVSQIPTLLSGGIEQSGNVLVVEALRNVGRIAEKLTASGGMSAIDMFEGWRCL